MSLMTTCEVNAHQFQAEIFRLKANFISPVAVYSKSHHGVQTLNDYFEEGKRHPRDWMTYAAPAGVGQYSLHNGPAGVLARHIAHFRQPTEEEIITDLNNFGDQVLGPSVKEVAEKGESDKYRHCPVFRLQLLREDHYFTGPPRLIKSVFVSRVFPGELPDDLSVFFKEVDETSEINEMAVPQCYQFVHANQGVMLYAPITNPAKYKRSDLSILGEIKFDKDRLFFFPGTDGTTKPIDFTDTLIF